MVRATRNSDPIDPRGLIREAYAIEGIGAPECRSIFLDWALGVPEDEDVQALIRQLLDRYGAEESHPMTGVLFDGLGAAARDGRRGGRKGRQLRS